MWNWKKKLRKKVILIGRFLKEKSFFKENSFFVCKKLFWRNKVFLKEQSFFEGKRFFWPKYILKDFEGFLGRKAFGRHFRGKVDCDYQFEEVNFCTCSLSKYCAALVILILLLPAQSRFATAKTAEHNCTTIHIHHVLEEAHCRWKKNQWPWAWPWP